MECYNKELLDIVLREAKNNPLLASHLIRQIEALLRDKVDACKVNIFFSDSSLFKYLKQNTQAKGSGYKFILDDLYGDKMLNILVAWAESLFLSEDSYYRDLFLRCKSTILEVTDVFNDVIAEMEKEAYERKNMFDIEYDKIMLPNPLALKDQKNAPCH